MNRRTFLKVFGGTGLVALGGNTFLLEPHRLAVSRYQLGNRQAGSDRISLAQISDLHIKRIDEFTRRIATTVNQLQPDVVLLTGDIVDRATTLPVLEKFLALLTPATPKYAILGNWENFSHVDLAQLKSTYAQHNTQLLINQSVVHTHGARSILFTGLDDTVEGQPQLLKALNDVTPQANHLILAHAPDQRDLFTSAEQTALEAFQPQYMLSGHTHGGQVKLFGFAPVLPRGSGRYIQGWYTDRAPQLYVSRGLGGSGTTARLGSTPEIALFDWHLA
jgi:uncharacterized protein